MATITTTQASPSKQANSSGWSGQIQKAVGVSEVSAIAVLGDKIELCKLPKGAVITGGWLKGDKLDSNGSGSALASVNIGVDCAVKAFSDRTSVSAASTSIALLSTWSIGPDAGAITGYQAAGVRNVPLGGLLSTMGPLETQDECKVYLTWSSSILALTTGTLIVEVDYFMATS
jgi:hypothetical protein